MWAGFQYEGKSQSSDRKDTTRIVRQAFIYWSTSKERNASDPGGKLCLCKGGRGSNALIGYYYSPNSSQPLDSKMICFLDIWSQIPASQLSYKLQSCLGNLETNTSLGTLETNNVISCRKKRKKMNFLKLSCEKRKKKACISWTFSSKLYLIYPSVYYINQTWKSK